MAALIQDLQYKFKLTSKNLILFFLKLFSGLFLGATLALVFEEILHYGMISFIIILVMSTAAFLKISKKWQFVSVAVFDLICILLGLLLRMYILVAPGG